MGDSTGQSRADTDIGAGDMTGGRVPRLKVVWYGAGVGRCGLCITIGTTYHNFSAKLRYLPSVASVWSGGNLSRMIKLNLAWFIEGTTL